MNRRAEEQYVRRLRAVFRVLHAEVMRVLGAELDRRGGKRLDAITRHGLQIDRIILHYTKQVPALVQPAYDEMAKQTFAENAERMTKILGVHPTGSLRGVIAAARDANIRLVENAGRDYADDVREVFDDSDNYGLRPEELKAKLLERGNVSESRAELIARDQTLKLNGALTKSRQVSAGVESYKWSTSLDERVRDTHAEMEGQIIRWDNPPDFGHPGEDFQCRCVAIPVVPELEDIFAPAEPDDED